MRWCCERGLAAIERSFDEVFTNYPSRPLGWLMRAVVLPLGVRRRGPSDALSRACANLLMAPGPQRDRLTVGVQTGTEGGAAKVERAFELVTGCASLRRRMADAGAHDADRALADGLISREEHQALAAAEDAVADAVAVDHFDADMLSPSDREIDGEPERRRLRVSGSS